MIKICKFCGEKNFKQSFLYLKKPLKETDFGISKKNYKRSYVSCKKCNHLCHCVEADHSDCKCENCECNGREEDKTYETGGVVIDSTQDCEACE